MKDMRVACEEERYLIVLMYKEAYFSDVDPDPCLPSGVVSLLQGYSNIFPMELLKELSSIRGFEHQINVMHGAQFSNRPAYKANPKELQSK